MNLLKNIFVEFFNRRYYYNSNSGRAYIEYICEKDKGFVGKICFFHFSSIFNLNGFHNIEILKFIKLFYSNAYFELYCILKYAIKNNIVVTMNSLNEYEFTIKFWNENLYIRNITSYIIKKHTGLDFNISNNKDVKFFELNISCKDTFCIKNIKVYTDKRYYQIQHISQYIESDNISMVLNVDKWDFLNKLKYEHSILIKLDEPIRFDKSQYLLDNYYYCFLSKYFKKEEIYLGFIEKNLRGDLIYFTEGYSIKA